MTYGKALQHADRFFSSCDGWQGKIQACLSQDPG